MDINKYRTTCFSGYRPEQFAFSLDDKDGTKYKDLKNRINNAITETLQMGYNTFLCGMDSGFDLLCAKVVIDIRRKRKYRNIQLIIVLPFSGHGFSGKWGRLHRLVTHHASQEIIIAPNKHTRSCYYLRNCFLINNSSYLICYWTGHRGGTAHTVSMAKQSGHLMRNIAVR
ncbi:MAG: SLOG family protein [Defluviitaleaceae bacterium]|nr:SLOG family protein [Defluviitaleaceae bacterium]